jgi:hypothetical protein
VQARLNAAGYSPEIIAPSCTHMGNAVSYFDLLAAFPGALSALDEICYHRYGGVSDANLQALAARGQQHGKRTSMLEWWSTGNGIDVVFKDLTMGRNGAWQQGVLAGIGGLDDDMGLYKVDVTNPAAPVVQINRKTRLTRQVYRFVRATRCGWRPRPRTTPSRRLPSSTPTAGTSRSSAPRPVDRSTSRDCRPARMASITRPRRSSM